MPLSEHEQRLLDQMERALASEDPKFASALRGSVRGSVRKQTDTPGASAIGAGAGLAVVTVVLGLAALIASVIMNIPAVGIVGFIAVVFGLFLIVTRSSEKKITGAQSSAQDKRNNPGFLQGLEDRWDRRQDNQ
jgi:threonine/homoserine/homoserine lactone efflux protein